MSHHHSQCQWSNELWILAKISISSDIELEIYHTVNRLRSFLSSCHLVIW